ncbi:cohesin domain-containing protein [Patescibacteria group bacterium]|nr:cohesin domain-containing protein [Patescibacteria group bacterium]
MIDLSKIKQINKKIIYAVVVFIIIFELVWAWQTLQKSKVVLVGNTASVPVQTEPAVISLISPKTDLEVGEKITVAINITSSKLTDGADIIIFYDPKVLTVMPDAQSGKPVTLGTLYVEYPLNSVDEKNGRIAVSGLASAQAGVIPKGIFGSIVFQVKVVGPTKVSLDFTPGSTIDCNVIETKTARDLLSLVNNLELNVMKN